MIEGEYIQLLMELGLSLLEAKVYFALCRIKTGKINTIYKISGVARQDLYRLMPTLEKLGLAEKILGPPVMYKAIPLKDGLYLLLGNKTRENLEIQKKTREAIKEIHELKDKAIEQSEESSQFAIISSEQRLLKIYDDLETKVQTSMDIWTYWKFGSARLFYRLNVVKKALKRGVKMRIIAYGREDELHVDDSIEVLMKSPLFEIRYLAPSAVNMVICDSKEIVLCVGQDKPLPSLWTDNPTFVKVMKENFEGMWNNAQKIPTAKPCTTLSKNIVM
jgi:sugar-specific transcriptional regulator TrmB